ncbi:MAG: hypothetical protein LBU65_10330 [Planctomycetaceae bacterium]|jgi:hypothetical protein|nr:hypothetical protein [Planctomycetaceae bacterium]
MANNEKLLDNIQDPDYKKMLEAIEEGKRIMLENPEADMPDFKNARAEP